MQAIYIKVYKRNQTYLNIIERLNKFMWYGWKLKLSVNILSLR